MSSPFPLADLTLLVPETLLAAAGLILLVVGSIGRGISNRAAAAFSVAALAACAGFVLWVQAPIEAPMVLFGGSFVVDRYAVFWKLLLLAATALSVLLSTRFVEEGGVAPTEFYSLILFATTGMLFMVSGWNLLSIWIALELMALASYILAGYFKRERKSNEAALKYFILGALSSGILLYGISLLYGATGTLQLDALAQAIPAAVASRSVLVPLGWLMLACGLFFKVAAVPFHMWTPDVYEGAPTPITAYLSVASKGASFAILVRILYQGLPAVATHWQTIVALVAAATMIWGNLAALTQTNVKRMLAYSSIAHAGYVLLGVLAVGTLGTWSVVFYLLAYTFINLGAFGTVIVLERREYAGETVEDYAGLAGRSPLLAAMMLFFLLALTGIPPTGGFVGKFYLFAAALQAGYGWVAIIGVLTSAISLYYYFRIVYFMYQANAEERTPEPLRSPALVGVIVACALVTLVLGLWPGPAIDLAKSAVLGVPPATASLP